MILSYHLRSLSSRVHRLRLALHVRGWRGVLARLRQDAPRSDAPEHGPAPASAPGPAIGAQGARVLVVDVTTPRPDRDSGSMRARALMRLLVELGYRVDFLPDDGGRAGPYTAALASDGVALIALPGRRARLRWLTTHAARYQAVIVSRYHLAEPLFPLLRRIAPGARLVLDTVDLHHLREQREAERSADRTLMRLAAATRRRELAMIDAADITWVVSPVEQALLAGERPGAVVRVVSNLHAPVADVPGPGGRRGLLFVGGAGHPPNVDAVAWLAGTLYPAIRQRMPDIGLHLVGEGLERVVPHAPPGITVHGHVPDLLPLLRTTRVGIAPLRFGAGVKGKVNLGLSHGLPMVVTRCAAEGLHLVHGEHALIADEPADLVREVLRAYTDDALWARVSAGGRALTGEHFTVDVARQAVLASLPPPTGPAS